MQEPTSSSIAHMQRRGAGSKTPIFWGKGEAMALSQNHRLAGVSRDVWFPLAHPLLKQQHPEQGAQYQTISRCLLEISQKRTPQPPWATHTSASISSNTAVRQTAFQGRKKSWQNSKPRVPSFLKEKKITSNFPKHYFTTEITDQKTELEVVFLAFQ